MLYIPCAISISYLNSQFSFIMFVRLKVKACEKHSIFQASSYHMINGFTNISIEDISVVHDVITKDVGLCANHKAIIR